MTIATPDSYEVDANLILRIPASTGLLANDDPGTGSPLTVLLGTAPLFGSVEVAADGSFVYTPFAGFAGADSFEYILRRTGEADVIGQVNVDVAGDLLQIQSSFDLALPGNDTPLFAQTMPLPGGGFAMIKGVLNGSTLISHIRVYDSAGIFQTQFTIDSIDASAAFALPNHGAGGAYRLVDVGNGKFVVLIDVFVYGSDPDDFQVNPVSDGFVRAILIDTTTSTSDVLVSHISTDSTYYYINEVAALAGDRFLVIDSNIEVFGPPDYGFAVDGDLNIYSVDGSLESNSTYQIGTTASDFSETLAPLRAVALPDGGAMIHTIAGVLRMSPAGSNTTIASGPIFDAEDGFLGLNIGLVGTDRFAVIHTSLDDENLLIYQLRALDGNLVTQVEINTSDLTLPDDFDPELGFEIAVLDDGTQLVIWAIERDDDSEITEIATLAAQLFSPDGERIGGVMRLGTHVRVELLDDTSPLVVTDGTSFLVLAGFNTGLVIDGLGVSYGPFRLSGEDASANLVRASRAPDDRILLQWDDGARYITLPAPPIELFSGGLDVVDFNNLTARQSGIIAALDQTFVTAEVLDAMAGDDTVVLPNLSNYDLPGPLHWGDPLAVFSGGGGSDRITGGDGNDRIDGAAGDDTLIGSPGNDQLTGGTGFDTFTFTAGFTGFASGTVQVIDGGEHPDGQTVPVPLQPDVLILPGRADEYSVTLTATGGTNIVHIANNITFNTTGVEWVRFLDSVTNPVIPESTVLEMTRLAIDAYPPAQSGRGWHTLSAVELGMLPNSPQGGSLQYSMANGRFEAVWSGFGSAARADAVVSIGIVGGTRVLSIAFAGTDESADYLDYFDFTTQHYAKFQPLIEALDRFIEDPANGIQQVFVSGHSLGAGMVQEFMSTHTGSLYQALTIGSPGGDNAVHNLSDSRIVNFIHTDDLVPMLGSASSVAPLLALLPQLGLLQLPLAAMSPKLRDGINVLIDSSADWSIGLIEHSNSLYQSSISALLTFANDPLSPFEDSLLGAAMRTGNFAFASDSRIALAAPTNASLTVTAANQFGLGTSASNVFELVGYFTTTVILDGGANAASGLGDVVAVRGAPADWTKTLAADGHYDLFFNGNQVAALWRIETLLFRDAFATTSLQKLGPDSQAMTAIVVPVVHLDGTPVNAQIVAAGSSAVQVDSGIDYADIGDGNRTVTGTDGFDFIVLGAGSQTANAGAGDDIVNAQRGLAGSVYAITGGGGNDYIVGNGTSLLTAMFSGNLADYAGALDSEGSLVLRDKRDDSPDGVDTLAGATHIQFADRLIAIDQYLDEFVPLVYFGTEGNDRFAPNRAQSVFAYGLDGSDVIAGGSRNDLLDGGLGADQLYGAQGDDTFWIDNPADLIFENAGEGTDAAVSTASHYLYANVENLTLVEGAGDLFGVGNELDNTLTGNSGENLLIGWGGIDTINGGGARDALFGVEGDDLLNGEGGIDYIVGGNGNDTINGGADADEMYGEDGNDTLFGGSSFDTDIMVGGAGDDTIFGNSGLGDFDFMYGNQGNDTFYVDTPADLVFEQPGEGTNDTVFADINGAGFYLYANIENLILLGNTPFGVGNDLANTLTGNDLGNYLLGGAGSDRIAGLDGNDVLFGEAGNDTFQFGANSGADVIGDFSIAQDVIEFAAHFTSFAQAQANFVQVGNDGAINLGGGNLIVLHGVTMANLTAANFTFAPTAEPLAAPKTAAVVDDATTSLNGLDGYAFTGLGNGMWHNEWHHTGMIP